LKSTKVNVSSLTAIDEKLKYLPALEEWIKSSMEKFISTNGGKVDYVILDERTKKIQYINSWLYHNVETKNEEYGMKMRSFNDFCNHHITP
jgi:hypothetical protein